MIILQLFAALVLFPFSILMLIVFNIYLTNWLYLILVTIFGTIYASLFGLLFQSMTTGICFFIILTVLYIVRMIYFAANYRVRDSSTNLHLVRGSIKCIGMNLVLLFPLTFLKILKIFPASWSKEIVNKAGLDLEISSIVDLILNCSKGARVEVNSGGVYLYFEIL